jgi:hypothetical protein
LPRGHACSPSQGWEDGLVQWPFLRAYADRADWVALGSGLGLATGFLLGFVLLGGFPFDFLRGFLGLGLGAGLSRWLVLRRRAPKTARLVPASALGYLLGGIAGIAAVFPFGDAIDAGLGSILVPALGYAVGEALTFAAIMGVTGAVAGLIGGSSSGLFLTRVLGRVHE